MLTTGTDLNAHDNRTASRAFTTNHQPTNPSAAPHSPIPQQRRVSPGAVQVRSECYQASTTARIWAHDTKGEAPSGGDRPSVVTYQGGGP